MIKISFQNLWARKRRLFGTFLAVFLGVAWWWFRRKDVLS